MVDFMKGKKRKGVDKKQNILYQQNDLSKLLMTTGIDAFIRLIKEKKQIEP
jgi:hypothetical protein